MLKLTFNYTNFAMNFFSFFLSFFPFFFVCVCVGGGGDGTLPTLVSTFELKKILHSPANIICLL